MDIINRIKGSVEDLVTKYKEEQNRKSKHDNIILGRIFSVGQYYPLILAEHLFSDSKDYIVLVDHHIKIGKKNLYPDLLVIDKKDKRAVAMIEVKLDLGWFNTTEGLDKLIQNYNLLGSRQVRVKYNGLMNTLTIDENLKKIFFVVTIANDHNRFNGVKEGLVGAGFQTVHCLEKSHHPNGNLGSVVIENDIKLNSNSLLTAFNWLK